MAAAFGRGPSESRESRKGPGLAQSERADFTCRDMGRTLPTQDAGLGWRGALGSYLMVPSPDVQDVPLGDRPVEGQAWHSIAKGERVLVVGDPSDVDGHLQGKN